MNEPEVQEANYLLSLGKTYDEVAWILGFHESTVRRMVRAYDIYGSSLFSKNPTQVISISCAEKESFSNQSSPFSFWLSQQQTSPKSSSES